MEEEKRLFLLDAYALIYRAYYALIRSPRITSKGQNVSAVFGFCNTLYEILRKENPSHIAVCFDPPGGTTFRHEMYADYKAGRDKQPEDITTAIPIIKEILVAYNIPVVERQGYEADDVIGTLSRRAESMGFDTYMMTPDKDYGQLVTDHVFMYRPALRGEGFEIRGPKQVCERYGLQSPKQVIDLLALEGDASDNIPGCPGVGEKTAVKLIAEFGSVETLVDSTDKLKGALQRKIADNREQILFSKDLATIRTDVPLDGITIDDLQRRPADVEALRDIFTRLEFRTFMSRLKGEPQAKTQPKPQPQREPSLFDAPVEEESADEAAGEPVLRGADDFERHYTMVADASEAVAAITRASEAKEIGFSILSRGGSVMQSTLYAIAISTSAAEALIITMPEDEVGRNAVINALKGLFGNKNAILCGHDIKRSMLLLRRENISFEAPYFDTAVAHYLIEPEMKHLPPFLAARYLSRELLPDSEPVDMRACELAELALQLRRPLLDNIAKLDMTSLLNNIELPFVRVLADMEWEGVRVDVDELKRLSVMYTGRMHEYEEEIYRLAGTRFNVSSPMQVGEILFGQMKLDPKAKRTKKGAYSTTEEILSKYAHEYPIVDLILKHRGLKKLLATYIDALPELVNPLTGKIHTTYNQTLTATGRISSADPNLQNIPVRTDEGREIRRAFVADPGDIFMSCDYSQIELRLMADRSGDPHMIEAFLSGEDIHRATAAKIYHVPLEEVTDNQRRNAKTANFGIIYGISAFGLSERLGIPRSEAKMLIDGYLLTYPKVREYMDNNIASARDKGYVSTIMGRRRQLPDINSRSAVMRGFSERNAVNAPLQGSAADIIKIAMINIDREIKNRAMKSRMIMQVHDELIFNVKPDELATLQEMVVDLMAKAYSGKVPLEVSSGTGSNWLEAH